MVQKNTYAPAGGHQVWRSKVCVCVCVCVCAYVPADRHLRQPVLWVQDYLDVKGKHFSEHLQEMR